jgi:hypothetical protein
VAANLLSVISLALPIFCSTSTSRAAGHPLPPPAAPPRRIVHRGCPRASYLRLPFPAHLRIEDNLLLRQPSMAPPQHDPPTSAPPSPTQSAHRSDSLQSSRPPPPPIPRQMATASSPPSPTSPRALPRPRLRPVSQIRLHALTLRLTLATASPTGCCWSRRRGCCETPGTCFATWASGRRITSPRLLSGVLYSAPAALQVNLELDRWTLAFFCWIQLDWSSLIYKGSNLVPLDLQKKNSNLLLGCVVAPRCCLMISARVRAVQCPLDL